jgi:hypothetical protein
MWSNIAQKEAVPFVRQLFAPMTNAGILPKLDHRRFQSIQNTVGGFHVVVGDVVPDIDDIPFALGVST